MAWLLPLILVLCSAGLHPGWNLIVWTRWASRERTPSPTSSF